MPDADAATAPREPRLEVVVPVYNEAHVLRASITTLHAHMRATFAFPFAITIADNASGDGTLDVARALARELPEIGVLHLDRKGRGRALRAAWSQSRAEVVAYMDVDLSTGLEALAPLVEPLLAGRGDVAIGSRLAPGAHVRRSVRRELISRTYNAILRLALGAGFSDAQCGFKAARREVLAPLLAAVADDEWFFDTELLYRAQRARLSIREIPVEWVEDQDSRVAIFATACADLRGVMRLRHGPRAAPAAGGATRAGAPGRRTAQAAG
ncbi:MAG TPA: dolichyl-phosphate beta-glucosyltransferase [Solirubrobacteraceae bacterium]|jgi:glycosyltransferase involved in cell wall biosynthesis|nr:dolichyl-phosphate beta-glucosyltransferase [Solirubrobacteraceae bacterium]